MTNMSNDFSGDVTIMEDRSYMEGLASIADVTNRVTARFKEISPLIELVRIVIRLEDELKRLKRQQVKGEIKTAEEHRALRAEIDLIHKQIEDLECGRVVKKRKTVSKSTKDPNEIIGFLDDYFKNDKEFIEWVENDGDK